MLHSCQEAYCSSLIANFIKLLVLKVIFANQVLTLNLSCSSFFFTQFNSIFFWVQSIANAPWVAWIYLGVQVLILAYVLPWLKSIIGYLLGLCDIDLCVCVCLIKCASDLVHLFVGITNQTTELFINVIRFYLHWCWLWFVSFCSLLASITNLVRRRIWCNLHF